MENNPTTDLLQILDSEKKRLFGGVKEQDIGLFLFELIRTLDFFKLKYQHFSDDELLVKLNELYHFGWNTLFALFFKESYLQEPIPLIQSESDIREWADSFLQYAGKMGLSRQFIDYEKAGLGVFSKNTDSDFIFQYASRNLGLGEFYEKLSYGFLYELKGKTIESEFLKHISNYNTIKQSLNLHLKEPLGGWAINYIPTPEIDDFYSRLGYFFLVQEQDYDDFSETDLFGGIQYKRYLDFVQEQIGIVIKHIDFCFALVNRNPKINLRDILTFVQSESHYAKIYSNWLNMSEDELKQIMSCVCLDFENSSYHLNMIAPPLPPMIKLSNSQIIRSSAGFKHKPCLFLQHELKRKFPSDYFKAVNNREERFRNELYSLIVGDSLERLLTVKRSVEIKDSSYRTDIDAAIFDKKTKTLALFQLKWQDSFGNSINERRSRISNLYPKSKEWIDKITEWTKQSSHKTILNSLGFNNLTPDETAIEEICLFVIARNHMHFTGVELDERASWASWYQLVEVYGRVKMHIDNPLKRLYIGIKATYPQLRSNFDKKPHLADYEIKFSKYKIEVKIPEN